MNKNRFNTGDRVYVVYSRTKGIEIRELEVREVLIYGEDVEYCLNDSTHETVVLLPANLVFINIWDAIEDARKDLTVVDFDDMVSFLPLYS